MINIVRRQVQIISLFWLISTAASADDTGTSHNLFLINRLDDSAFFVGRANLVTRDGISDPFFGYIDVNYRYLINKRWAIEPGYRQAMLELTNGWRKEYRPMISLYGFGTIAEGRFSNRSRIEFRYFEGNAKDRIRFRNESVWRSNNGITRYGLKPFIEEEFFIDLTDNKFNENWLTLGISNNWNKNIKWKLGYRLQSRRPGDEWLNRHLLVTGIGFFWM